MYYKILIIVIVAMTSSLSHAVDLEYKGFYKRLDLIKEEKLEQITMAFYLVDYQTRVRCSLISATMLASDLEPVNIEIEQDGQLLVVLSKELYDKFAFLRVKQADERQNCTLQMQIQAKDKTKIEYSFAELALITKQMQDLVNSFGSFLWFMMPDVNGLHFIIADNNNIEFIAEELKPGLSCTLNKCNLLITADNQLEQRALLFKYPPQFISPWIAED